MKRLLSTALLTLLITLGLTAPVFAAENPLDKICQETPQASACAGRDQPASGNGIYGPDGIITKVTNIIAFIAGAAAVIVIIVAGLQYILSNGDSAKVSTAKDAILYALVGLVVIALARTIILFVVGRI